MMTATVHRFPGRPRPRLALVNPDDCPVKPAGSTVPDPKRRSPAWAPVEGFVTIGQAGEKVFIDTAQRRGEKP